MIICIIQAREKSTRLPNKVLYKACGKTFLEHCYDRCKKSKADKIVVATTTNSKKIQKLCKSKKLNYYIGDENDVLSRYYYCAKKHQADYIIRITSDCPVIDYNIINEVIDTHIKDRNDFTTNAWIGKETYPDGLDVSIINYPVLQELFYKASGKDREHVVTHLFGSILGIKYKLRDIRRKPNLSNYRWTLDYKEDLTLIKMLYAKLYKNNKYFGMHSIFELYKKYPGLYKINSKYKRNEGYV